MGVQCVARKNNANESMMEDEVESVPILQMMMMVSFFAKECEFAWINSKAMKWKSTFRRVLQSFERKFIPDGSRGCTDRQHSTRGEYRVAHRFLREFPRTDWVNGGSVSENIDDGWQENFGLVIHGKADVRLNFVMFSKLTMMLPLPMENHLRRLFNFWVLFLLLKCIVVDFLLS